MPIYNTPKTFFCDKKLRAIGKIHREFTVRTVTPDRGIGPPREAAQPDESDPPWDPPGLSSGPARHRCGPVLGRDPAPMPVLLGSARAYHNERDASIYIYIFGECISPNIEFCRPNSTCVENQFCRAKSMGSQNGRGHVLFLFPSRKRSAFKLPMRNRGNPNNAACL